METPPQFKLSHPIAIPADEALGADSSVNSNSNQRFLGGRIVIYHVNDIHKAKQRCSMLPNLPLF